MTYDEYKAVISEIVAGGDDAADKGASVMEAIKADDEKRAEDAKTISNQAATIKKLKSDLFLLRTGGKQEDATGGAPKEETPEETFTKLFNDRYYGGEK